MVCFVSREALQGISLSFFYVNKEMNKLLLTSGFVQQPFVLLLKGSQCVGLCRKLHSWRKCQAKHTSTLHSSR